MAELQHAQGTAMAPTSAEREEILKLYEGLRVTDVSDGMDAVGLQDVGLMDNDIRPLWRDIDGFRHRIWGIAHTVRFVPTNKRAPVFATVEEHLQWKAQWYSDLSKGPIGKEIRAGDIIVIDAAGIDDCGPVGSSNTLGWLAAGARGAVTNGGARDTDELIKEQVPVYSRGVSRGIRPGRLEVESTNKPITCGSVFVRPGDVVVADGDGVIVVPFEKAVAVAKAAIAIQENDKKTRRRLYERLNRPPDFTLTPRQ